MTGDTAAAPFRLPVELACPRCRTPVKAALRQIVDLAREPALRPAVVQGTVHDVDCPGCGATLKLSPPLLVWNPTVRQLLAFHAGRDIGADDAHFAQLAHSLRASQPEAQGAPIVPCASRGALVEALLEGHWDAPEAAGLKVQGIWREVFPRLPQHVRIRVFDILAEGSQKDVLAAAQTDMEMAAAMQIGTDPDGTAYTGAMRVALQAVSLSSLAAPERLFDTIVAGLAETADDAAPHAQMRRLLSHALIDTARRLPWTPDTADAWLSRAARMVPALPNARDLLAMLEIATLGYGQLPAPPYDPVLAAALSYLFDIALRTAAPAPWAPVVLEQLGDLALGIVPPDLNGLDDLADAAQGFADSQRPVDAARIWQRLMRWHAARAGGGDGVDDPAAEAEASIVAGNMALQLADQLPQEQAMATVRALADTAWHMPGDGRIGRLALAAKLYRQLLPVVDAIDTPAGQVLARLNLANILLDNAGGDDMAAVEEALALLQPLADHPGVAADATLAFTHLGVLALAWKRRTAGDLDYNLERAIDSYRRALLLPGPHEEVHGDVVDGALRYNLANALLRRRRGNRVRNLGDALLLHEAVRHAREAAAVAPQLLARSCTAIGNVHYERAVLDTPPDPLRLERAIKAYAQARQHFDASRMPSDVALAAMLEGQAHALLPHADPRRETALSIYAQAADFAQRAGDVALQEDIASRRGSMLFRDRRLAEAVDAYREALRCRRELMALATSGLTRQRQLGGMAPYAARLAYALIHTGRVDEGIDALQSARALDLAGALRGVQADSEESARYREARAEMLKLEAEEEQLGGQPGGTNDDGLHALHLRLQQAREQLAKAAQALGPAEPADVPTGLAALGLGLDTNTLLAVPIVTDIGTTIVFAGGGVAPADALVQREAFTLPMLRRLLGVGSATAPAAPEEDPWQAIVAEVAAKAGRDVPDRMVRFFARLGGTPLVQALRERLAATGAQDLRVAALGGLQSLPLSMALDPGDFTPLAWQARLTAQIGLAPGASARRLTARRPRLLIVADPQGDLPFARWEAALIADSTVAAHAEVEIEVLQGAEASMAALLARIEWADILHFAGHAVHDPTMATRSSIACADGLLSVQALRTVALRAPLELVVLSACDSGLTDAERLPDEFIGLPAAFFALGAQVVVSAMWSLPDEATALLMSEFYRGVLSADRAPYADALAEAQHMLASSTAAELRIADRLDVLYQTGQCSDPLLAKRVLAHRRAPDARPFAHPLYWGAHACQAR